MIFRSGKVAFLRKWHILQSVISSQPGSVNDLSIRNHQHRLKSLCHMAVLPVPNLVVLFQKIGEVANLFHPDTR
jgi:hypothetical protein